MQSYYKYSSDPPLCGDTFYRFCSNLEHLFYRGTFGESVYKTIDTVVSMNPETFADLIDTFGPNLGDMVREIKTRQFSHVYPIVTKYLGVRRCLLSNKCPHTVAIGIEGVHGCRCHQIIGLSGASYTGHLENGFGVEHANAIINHIWPNRPVV